MYLPLMVVKFFVLSITTLTNKHVNHLKFVFKKIFEDLLFSIYEGIKFKSTKNQGFLKRFIP